MTNKGGRFTKCTPKVVQKLTETFKLGATVEEACCDAEISSSAYHDWLSNNKRFSGEIKLSKEYLKIKSRQIVAQHIEKGDLKTAMWYLERKLRKEFNPQYLEDEMYSGVLDPLGERLRELGLR